MGTGSIPTPTHSYPEPLPITPVKDVPAPCAGIDVQDDVQADSGPREECGVFGVWGHPEAARHRRR